MTEQQLKKANELKQKIEKLEAAEKSNFSLNIANFTISESDLSPETVSKIKRVLLGEKESLEETFAAL